MNRLVEPFKQIQKQLGENVPLDGVAVVLYAFSMPYNETQRIQNSLVLGGLHWFLHEYVTCRHQNSPRLML